MTAKSLQEARQFYAKQMAAASETDDPRLERAFELVPREAFLPPGPWLIKVHQRYVETPSADPVFLYQNSLVAIDVPRGINNGEPFLHAAWIGAAAPSAGEIVCHVGAGTAITQHCCPYWCCQKAPCTPSRSRKTWRSLPAAISNPSKTSR